MKLNYKRTVLVGLAFLSISAFWQMYDTVVPLMLKYTFELGDTLAGFMMALDNILALFMLPLFGALSDRCRHPLGRRMPFILIGTFAAAVLAVALPLADNAANLPAFIACLGLLLVSMSVYRSPAVALMPDVTPKPLRSKGNAVINLMGALGGVFSLGAIALLSRTPQDAPAAVAGEVIPKDYTLVFVAVAALMVVAVIALALAIRERRLVAEMEAIHYGVAPEEGPSTPDQGMDKLPREVRRSLILILLSVSLWFMGYNAVTTAFSKYAQESWNMDAAAASLCLMVATGTAILFFLPVGILSSRIGRKRTIQFGVVLLAACFGLSALFTQFSPAMYLMFSLVGFAWACINVNSYPMVVEISRGSDVGRYTGYYYTFSMAAQIVTPILSGYLLEHVGYWTLFPYAAVMVALAMATISFVRHGDSRPTPPASKLEAFDAGD